MDVIRRIQTRTPQRGRAQALYQTDPVSPETPGFASARNAILKPLEDWQVSPLKNPLEQLQQRIRAHRAGIPYQPVRPAGAVAARKKEPGPIARLVDAWWTRLLSSIYEGSLSAQDAEYESGETVRDYLWNTIGVGVWGAVFPILTVVATQLAGPEQAGMFSMAFVAGTLLMILSNYGVRTFQVSDIEQTSSFNSYQVNRWLTSLLALGAGWLYCSVRGYGTHMFTLSMGVYIYKIVDGLADVYEGRLQQEDKLYLGGISQALRSVLVIAVFSVLLFVTRSIGIAAAGMGAAAVASLILVTVPLALLETDPSAPWRMGEVAGLFRQCFPLFSTLFLFNVIESMPKFAMESMLPYDAQLYFNALFFPAQGILITAGFMYKPQLLRLANIWSNPRRRKRFDLIVLAMLGVIAVITGVTAIMMSWIGIPVMNFMYGLDFEPYRLLAVLMVCAGGVTAAIDFIYAIITVLRHQESATRPYLITFACSIVIPTALVALMGLTGAVIGYLVTMTILLVLLAISYRSIRTELSSHTRSPFH